MKFNKIFKEDYNTYFRQMYGSQWKKKVEPEVKEEPKPEDNPVIEKYLDKIHLIKNGKLARDYRKIVDDIKEEKDPAKIKELETKKDGIEQKLEELLNREKELGLDKNRIAKKLAMENGIVYSFDKLIDEILNESILVGDEKELIFGETLNIVSDILSLDEAQKVTQGNVNQAIKNAQKKSGDISLDNMARTAARNAVADKVQQDIDERKSKDPLVGVTESANQDPVVAAKKKSLATIETKIDKTREQNQKEMESLQDQKEKKQAEVERASQLSNNGKDTINDVNSINEDFVRISPDLRKEMTVSKDLRSEKKVSKDLRDEKTVNKRDTSKYDSMLYNGASGEVLKYVIKGEINNNNIEVLEVSKLVKADPDAQIIIKKIEALLKKASRKELSYDEYTQLKVLKSQFKSVFTKFKNQYNNRYKN